MILITLSAVYSIIIIIIIIIIKLLRRPLQGLSGAVQYMHVHKKN